MMCNDGSEERIWLKFGRQTLTEMDKLIIVRDVCVCVCVCVSVRVRAHMWYVRACVVYDVLYHVITGQMLTDKHINFAQAILKHQFSNVSGLQSTLIIHKANRITSINASRMLQALHSRGCHWIAISTIGIFPQVMVYDSTFTFVDQDTQKLLKKIAWR